MLNGEDIVNSWCVELLIENLMVCDYKYTS